MTAEIVERRSPPHPGAPWGKTHDFLGCIDIIAIDAHTTLAVQSCGSAFSEHRRKMVEDCAHELEIWLSNPDRRVELWGWRKLKKVRGGKQMVWRPRVEEITLSSLE
jgi:hypothetical protein